MQKPREVELKYGGYYDEFLRRMPVVLQWKEQYSSSLLEQYKVIENDCPFIFASESKIKNKFEDIK